jgi:hypothetical protein
MDLKALMQKLETIDKKQNLMEAEKKETTWTDKSGKKHPATQVKGDKYTGKEAEKDDKKKTDEGIVFNSSIAQMLLREFGLEEAPVANPYQGADAEKFAAMSPADQAWLTKGGGKPDINDQFILARAPNKGKPALTAPTAGGQAASPAPASNTQDMGDGSKLTTDPKTGATAATNDDGTPYIPGSNPNLPKNQTKTQDMGDGSKLTTGPGGVAATNDDGTPYVPGSNPNLPQNKPASGQAASPAMTAADQDDADMGAAMRANAQAANGVNAAGQNVTMPDGTNPETGEKTTVATAPAAGGQAASPAKPAAAKPAFKADPVGQSIANQLKMTTPDAIKLFQKNNGLPADGMIGPATTKALQAAAQKMGVTTTSGVGTSTAGAGRGGQGGPTATQMAQAASPAKPAGGQAASPAAPAADAPAPSLINRFRASRGLPTSEEISAPTRQESIRSEDDEILARIKSAFRF